MKLYTYLQPLHPFDRFIHLPAVLGWPDEDGVVDQPSAQRSHDGDIHPYKSGKVGIYNI
jgi:hypothetical protein